MTLESITKPGHADPVSVDLPLPAALRALSEQKHQAAALVSIPEAIADEPVGEALAKPRSAPVLVEQLECYGD